MTPESSLFLPLSLLPAHSHNRLAGADDDAEAQFRSDDDGEDRYGKPKQKKNKKSKKRPLLSPLLLFSLLSFSLGLIGLSLSAYALLHSSSSYSSVAGFLRCRGSEDTARVARLANPALRSRAQIDLVSRPRLLGLVGVQTGFYSREVRMALRDTWFPTGPEELLRLEHATGLAFRFVIGHTKDVKQMAGLHEEVDKYNDFLLLGVEEEDLKLPYKTLAFLKAAFDLFDAEFYVKVDDDVYLRPDRLASLLAKDRIHPSTYIGCMKKGPVITDPKMKWYEAAGQLLGKEYFYHAHGPVYALSAEVVAGLANTKNDSLRIFSNEDVTIGSWMLAMNVNHEDSRAMCDPRCSPTSIAVWDNPKCSGLCNPADRLRALHKTSMCSKSPTIARDGK